MFRCGYMRACVCGDQRATLGVNHQESFILFFKTMISLVWRSPNRQGWMVSELLESACLRPPSWGLQACLWPAVWFSCLFWCYFLHMGSGDWTQILTLVKKALLQLRCIPKSVFSFLSSFDTQYTAFYWLRGATISKLTFPDNAILSLFSLITKGWWILTCL